MSGGPTIAHVNDIAFVGSTLAAEQRRRGGRVVVIEAAKPGASLPYPWKWLAVPLRATAVAAAAWAVRDADVVHVHYATQGLIGRLSGRPHVVHCHGSDVRGVGPRSLGGRLLRRSMAAATHVLYATPDLAAEVQRYRRDARFVPNPIDVELFTPASPGRDVLVATRLDPIKGAAAVLDVLDEVLRSRPSTSATIILDGPLAAEARSRFRGRAAFLARRPHTAMPALMANHRVAVGQFHLGILSQLELEAMACGAVVASPIRHPEPDREPAPVIAYPAPRDAAGAVTALLDNPSALERAASASRDWVVRHHAVGHVVSLLEPLYADARSSASPRWSSRHPTGPPTL